MFQITGQNIAAPSSIKSLNSDYGRILSIDADGVNASHLAGIVNAEPNVCVFNFNAPSQFWKILRNQCNKDFFLFDKDKNEYIRVYIIDGYMKYQSVGNEV
jgi:hypothetical protein